MNTLTGGASVLGVVQSSRAMLVKARKREGGDESGSGDSDEVEVDRNQNKLSGVRAKSWQASFASSTEKRHI